MAGSHNFGLCRLLPHTDLTPQRYRERFGIAPPAVDPVIKSRALYAMRGQRTQLFVLECLDRVCKLHIWRADKDSARLSMDSPLSTTLFIASRFIFKKLSFSLITNIKTTLIKIRNKLLISQ